MSEPSAATPPAGTLPCTPRVVIRAHQFQSPADAPKLHGCSQSLEPGELPSQTVSVSRRLSVIDSSAIRLEDLPSNPEHWLPSQLGAWIASTLTLHPRVREDLVDFVRTSALSGRTFVGLTDKDLELALLEMNVLWRPALLAIRDQLRCQSATWRPREVPSDDVSESDAARREWVNSWRRGPRTEGRVRGMASAIDDSPGSAPLDRRRTTSTSSLDSVASFPPFSSTPISSNPSSNAPFPALAESNEAPSLTNPSLNFSKSHLSRPSLSGIWASGKSMHDDATQTAEREGGEDEGGPGESLKSPAGSTRGAGTLADLFGLEPLASAPHTAERMVPDDLVTRDLDGKGTLVLVRRSQLEELGRRMKEVEDQLAIALAPTRALASPPPAMSTSDAAIAGPSCSLSFFREETSGLADHRETEVPAAQSWLGLAGFVAAASIGIGLVAGEVVILKLFSGLARSRS